MKLGPFILHKLFLNSNDSGAQYSYKLYTFLYKKPLYKKPSTSLNRAARIITGSSFTTSALPLIESFGWKTIEELISNETKVCVFKALKGLDPQCLTELFSRNSQRSLHILRSTSTDLKLPLFKTANGQKCFSFRGVKYLNSLSAESKQAVTIHSLKASI